MTGNFYPTPNLKKQMIRLSESIDDRKLRDARGEPTAAAPSNDLPSAPMEPGPMPGVLVLGPVEGHIRPSTGVPRSKKTPPPRTLQ